MMTFAEHGLLDCGHIVTRNETFEHFLTKKTVCRDCLSDEMIKDEKNKKTKKEKEMYKCLVCEQEYDPADEPKEIKESSEHICKECWAKPE